MWFLCIFMIFDRYNPTFLTKSNKLCSEMQIADNQFILHPKSIAVLACCQIFVFKGCLHNTVTFSILVHYQIIQIIESYSEDAGILWIYLYLGHEFLCRYKEKIYIFTGVNYLGLISDSCQKMCFFPYWSWWATEQFHQTW